MASPCSLAMVRQCVDTLCVIGRREIGCSRLLVGEVSANGHVVGERE